MWKFVQSIPRAVRSQLIESNIRPAPPAAYQDKPAAPIYTGARCPKQIAIIGDSANGDKQDEDNFCWRQMTGCGHMVDAVGLGAALLLGCKLVDYWRLRQEHCVFRGEALGIQNKMVATRLFMRDGPAKKPQALNVAQLLQNSQANNQLGLERSALELPEVKMKQKKSSVLGTNSSFKKLVKDETSSGIFHKIDSAIHDSHDVQTSQSSLSSETSSTGASSSFHVSHAFDELRLNLDQVYDMHEASMLNHRAVKAANDGNYSLALKCWRRAADKGNEKAMFNIGLCFEKGLGVPVNVIKAMSYYHQAANKGSGAAAHNLALLLMESGEPRHNLMSLLQSAVDKNVVMACTLLGVLHMEEGNTEQAARLFEKAAASKDHDACYFLAVCLEGGIGVEQNHSKAVQMYARAASTGHEEAIDALTTLVSRSKSEESRKRSLRLSFSSPDMSHSDSGHATMSHSSSCSATFSPSVISQDCSWQFCSDDETSQDDFQSPVTLNEWIVKKDDRYSCGIGPDVHIDYEESKLSSEADLSSSSENWMSDGKDFWSSGQIMALMQ